MGIKLYLSEYGRQVHLCRLVHKYDCIISDSISLPQSNSIINLVLNISIKDNIPRSFYAQLSDRQQIINIYSIHLYQNKCVGIVY